KALKEFGTAFGKESGDKKKKD
ncbi:MAG: hypothetical protein JWP87_5940, partial [Labilithrix sp.]|nr:hypothetical protein [Labilithrix sp.]